MLSSRYNIIEDRNPEMRELNDIRAEKPTDNGFAKKRCFMHQFVNSRRKIKQKKVPIKHPFLVINYLIFEF